MGKIKSGNKSYKKENRGPVERQVDYIASRQSAREDIARELRSVIGKKEAQPW